jgi:hypothetical protein
MFLNSMATVFKIIATNNVAVFLLHKYMFYFIKEGYIMVQQVYVVIGTL